MRTSSYNFSEVPHDRNKFLACAQEDCCCSPADILRAECVHSWGWRDPPASSLLGALHWVSSERLMHALIFVVVLSILAAPRVVLAICISDHSLWGGREVEGRAARGVCAVAHASGLFWLRALQAYLGFPRRANRARYAKFPARHTISADFRFL